jgi:hypothetical protein
MYAKLLPVSARPILAAVAIVGTLFTGSVAANDHEVIVAIPDAVGRGGQASARSVRDQAALNACADAFLAGIAPGTTARARLLMPDGQQAILSPFRPSVTMEVTMEARSGRHELLARSTCVADYQAKVTHLWTSVLQPATLARGTSRDITLALVSRL